MIARIQTSSVGIRKIVHLLLLNVDKHHPQALLYPLTVISKSQNAHRRDAAISLLSKMKTLSSDLVEQAMLVSQELVRVAVLWSELWYSGLEEAARLYFGHQNVQGMFRVLESLGETVSTASSVVMTNDESCFLKEFGSDINQALCLVTNFKTSGNAYHLNAAWDIFHGVFRRLSKKLSQMSILELTNVSPRLLQGTNFELAVPGTYSHDGYGEDGHAQRDPVKILSFHPVIPIIASKQRPRKLVIYGTDGQTYKFLLKGHEDLRQDERVMQLFGLINSLLCRDKDTLKRGLAIRRYPVIPLSQNTGLLGWVPHCDTLHSLIKEYREKHNMPLNYEHKTMLQVRKIHSTPHYY